MPRQRALPYIVPPTDSSIMQFKVLCQFCSQELLEAVEQERSASVNPSRNTTIFHHPALGDFELQGVCILPMRFISSTISSKFDS